MQIYEFLNKFKADKKAEDQRHLTTKERKMTVNLVATVAAATINAIYIVKVLGTFTRI